MLDVCCHVGPLAGMGRATGGMRCGMFAVVIMCVCTVSVIASCLLLVLPLCVVYQYIIASCLVSGCLRMCLVLSLRVVGVMACRLLLCLSLRWDMRCCSSKGHNRLGCPSKKEQLDN